MSLPRISAELSYSILDFGSSEDMMARVFGVTGLVTIIMGTGTWLNLGV